MCLSVINVGFGLLLDNIDDVFFDLDWYVINQFMFELIFYNRMWQYKCFIRDFSCVDVIFVFFYVGLEIIIKLWGVNIVERDDVFEKLQSWFVN